MLQYAYLWFMESVSSYSFWISSVVMYGYFSICLYKTAQNCGQKEKAWWAFVPVLQFVLVLELANIPSWHILILLVPIINIVAFAIAWVRIAKNCGLTTAWGVLTVIPVLNILAMAKLAASKPKKSFFSLPSEIIQSRTPQRVG